jgi:hypothetical protein
MTRNEKRNATKVVRTQYMDKPLLGYSEYYFYDSDARESIAPNVGDRCVMRDGSVFFCWDKDIGWEKIGG